MAKPRCESAGCKAQAVWRACYVSANFNPRDELLCGPHGANVFADGRPGTLCIHIPYELRQRAEAERKAA